VRDITDPWSHRMSKLVTAAICTTLLVAASSYAAEPKGTQPASAAAQREKSKDDWLKECVDTARQRDSSLTQDAALSTCKKTTGTSSATHARMPGHSGPTTPSERRE
jgi:hypothetical protein